MSSDSPALTWPATQRTGSRARLSVARKPNPGERGEVVHADDGLPAGNTSEDDTAMEREGRDAGPAT